MIKKVALVVILIFFAACKSNKRTVSSTKKPTTHLKQNSTGEVTEVKTDDGNFYMLPEDSGRFIDFPINSVQEYIDTFSEIAQFEMKAYGIPASITLAQGILESGYGRSTLAKKTNNHFGIKCHKGLKDAGYATDRKYPNKLISFIEQYQLYKYDTSVQNQGYVEKKQPKEYEYSTHTVQKGDTLYSISRAYFVSVDELMKINKMNSSNLSIGQKVVVKSQKK
mgnify:CR=1 FL=1